MEDSDSSMLSLRKPCPFPDRCKYPPVVADISGSMCVGYSSMGKKQNGELQNEKSTHNKLMLLWIIYHGRAKTPVVVHENVKNFKTSYLIDKMEHFDYKYVGQIQTCGADAGLAVNNRTRVHFDCKSTRIFGSFLATYSVACSLNVLCTLTCIIMYIFLLFASFQQDTRIGPNPNNNSNRS